MKKALSYMLVGACMYGAVDLWMTKGPQIMRHMKKMKKSGLEACEKIKAIF